MVRCYVLSLLELTSRALRNELFENWPATLALPLVYSLLHRLMIEVRPLQFVAHNFLDLYAIESNYMLIQCISIHICRQGSVRYGWCRGLKHFCPAADMMLIYVFHEIIGQLQVSP